MCVTVALNKMYRISNTMLCLRIIFDFDFWCKELNVIDVCEVCKVFNCAKFRNNHSFFPLSLYHAHAQCTHSLTHSLTIVSRGLYFSTNCRLCLCTWCEHRVRYDEDEDEDMKLQAAYRYATTVLQHQMYLFGGYQEFARCVV